VNIAPVGTATQGAGRWGQLDLVGEVFEWNADWAAIYVNPCADCAYLTAASYRASRGGLFGYYGVLLPSARWQEDPTSRNPNQGFRCARAP
jgi:formylglycine-generating enzyme required for sulfatase activity